MVKALQAETPSASPKGVKKTGTPLSKQVGKLNASAILKKPIMFSEVEEPLMTIGMQEALSLLKELESKAASVRDPSGWLKRAVQNNASGGSDVMATGGFAAGTSILPVPPVIAQSSMANSGGSADIVKKTVGRLNKGGTLQKPIQYTEVAGPLAACGADQAKALLLELEQKQATIRDPTAWLKAAADKGGAAGVILSSGMLDDVAFTGGSTKIRKRVKWLNEHAKLAEQIEYRQVAGVLEMIGDAAAMLLLKELEEKASEVKKPSGWIVKAAGNRFAGHSSKAVKTEIGLLNKSGQLQEIIKYDEVNPYLIGIPDSAALELLQELGQKASEIKAPTNWLKAAASRAASHGSRKRSNAEVSGGAPKSSISKKVGMLNKTAGFSKSIQFSEVVGPLSALSEEMALGLLDQVGAKGSSCKDPTAWLQKHATA